MSWTGLDLDGNQVTHPDRDVLIAILRLRDRRIRRRRVGRGQDPEPDRHPVTWESTPGGESIGFGRSLARIDRRLDARAALKDRRARSRWGIGPAPSPGAA